jgi:hypothetical protein
MDDPSYRAGAEPDKPTDSADGPGERTADTRRTSQVDDIPSITLIRGESIILITLTQLPDQPMFTQPPYRRPGISTNRIHTSSDKTNAKQRGVDWQFKINDARRKLKRLHAKTKTSRGTSRYFTITEIQYLRERGSRQHLGHRH